MKFDGETASKDAITPTFWLGLSIERDEGVVRSVRGTRSGWFAVAVAIGALILAPGSASAELRATGAATNYTGTPTIPNPVFEQYADCTGSGAASQEFPDFSGSVLQSADDFEISELTCIYDLVALGSFGNPSAADIQTVTVEIYDSDGPSGLPGTLLCFETGLIPYGGPGDPALQLSLDATCCLDPGTYWLSVMPVMDFGGGAPGQWFWSSNATGFGSEFVFRDPDELLGPGPCDDWAFGQTTCGIDSSFPDLCLGIGEYGDDLPGDVPAVSTTGAVVILLVVMAFSFFFLRRCQTA